MTRTCRFITFGCKANQYDTQRLRELLEERGWSDGEAAPALIVVNTCTVTSGAGSKARKLVRRLRREHPGARIVVTGCLAEAEPAKLLALGEVDAVIGNRERESASRFLRSVGEEVDGEELGLPPGIRDFAGHTRAFVKIQDGCNHDCAFCIIPSVRGPSRSRPIAELAGEVSALVERGYRELVLCGIHIGEYGLDLGTDLAALVRALAHLDGDFRLRLSSIEATEVSAELLSAMAETGRVCHHLHLPLQSGDDAVLRAMNRWYGRAEYLDALGRIRSTLDQPAITGDVIVGFPGESDARFENTVETVRRAGFCRLHIFPFSARPGTAAAALEGGGDPRAIRERHDRLAALVASSAHDYRRALVGRRERVVFERARSGLSERYQRFGAGAGPDRSGELLDVRIERLEAGGLYGTIDGDGTSAMGSPRSA